MFIKFLLMFGLLFSTNYACAGDINYSHTFANGQVLTHTQLEVMKAEIANEVNDLDSDNFASNVSITSSGAMTFTGTSTLSTVDINAGNIDGTAIGSASASTAKVTTLLAEDKVSFTQTDNNEYIDSLADGYLDIEATTGIRMRINGTEQLILKDGVLEPTTDNDVDLGASGKEFKDLFIDGTANIDSLVADTADINGGTLDGVQIGGATTTGTIFYNDASDNTVGLVPGADNLVLTSTGTSGIPAYQAITTGNLAFVRGGATPLGSTTCIGEGEACDGFLASDGKYGWGNSGNGSVITFVAIPWLKLANVNTIKGKIYLEANDTYDATISVDISGNTDSEIISAGTDGLTGELSIDVSGLSDGTWYTVNFKGDHASSGSTLASSYVSSWTFFGE